MASINIAEAEIPQELLKNRYSARDSLRASKKKVDLTKLRAVKPLHN
jgi:hypothetical protein